MNELTPEQLEARRASARRRYAKREAEAKETKALVATQEILDILGVENVSLSKATEVKEYILTNFKFKN